MSDIQTDDPMVTRQGVFDVQVCVPEDWSDEQVKAFADREYECGTRNGWIIRRGHEMPDHPERNACEERDGFVHIMLDA